MDTLIDQLKAIDTPTLSNAIEKLQVRNRMTGFCDLSLKCLFPELGVMCGYAVTAQVETMHPDAGEMTKDRRKLIELSEALEQSPKPGVIVLQEVGPHRKFAVHCGEVMATLFKKLGAVGLVSDSAVRDKPEVQAIGFHYFATGLVASHANFKILRVQVPVTVCGLSIKPGDLLHGDVNGLISVPEQGRDELTRLVEQARRWESKLLEYMKDDQFTLEGFYQLLIH